MFDLLIKIALSFFFLFFIMISSLITIYFKNAKLALCSIYIASKLWYQLLKSPNLTKKKNLQKCSFLINDEFNEIKLLIYHSVLHLL